MKRFKFLTYEYFTDDFCEIEDDVNRCLQSQLDDLGDAKIIDIQMKQSTMHTQHKDVHTKEMVYLDRIYYSFLITYESK